MRLKTKDKMTFLKGLILGILLPIIMLLIVLLPIGILTLICKTPVWYLILVMMEMIFFGELFLLAAFSGLMEWGRM